MSAPVTPRRWNWRLWVGFVVSLVALLAYPTYIMRVSLIRTIFWPSVLLFLVAAMLLVSGLRRVSSEPQSYRGKISGPILTTLSVLIFALFGFFNYSVFKNFPAANNAPKVGQRAPEFTLVDANGKSFSLAQLRSTPMAESTGSSRPAKGVLVFFYRGYW
jgi:hypothetical protein